jgi:hypothetical protein
VVLSVLIAVALRVPFVGRPAYPDEGGLLLVAEHWSTSGPSLYGHLFVDRPPALLLFFLAASNLGGIEAARWLGLLFVSVFVVAAGRAGWLLGGRRGAGWSALTAAVLASSPVLGADEVNAELIGLPLVMAGVALALEAWHHPRGRTRELVLLALAGLVLGTAPMVKQNLVDGAVFVALLVLVQARVNRWPARRLATTLVSLGAGAAVPSLVLAGWAQFAGPGFGAAWEAVVGFRFDASAVLAAHDSPATEHRLGQLPILAVTSGLAAVALVALWRLRRKYRDPVVLATTGMLLVALVGVAGGGSYWPHYLITLVPATVLLVARAVGVRSGRVPWVPLAIAVAFGSAMVSVVASTTSADTQYASPQIQLASWLRAASAPGDSAVVAYGQAQIMQASGMQPAYPYLWSLPVRTLDPELRTLARRLSQDDGPDWFVEWHPVGTWSLDSEGRVARALADHYRYVAQVCGTPVYLRLGNQRVLPPLPSDCEKS